MNHKHPPMKSRCSFLLLLSIAGLPSCHWLVDFPNESPANQNPTMDADVDVDVDADADADADAIADADTDADKETTPLLPEDFCDVFTRTLCQASQRCCDEEPLSTIDECIDENIITCDVFIQPIIDEPYTMYSATIAREVINELELYAETCSLDIVDFVSDPTRSLRFFEGRNGENWSCHGVLLSPPSYFTCARPLTCIHNEENLGECYCREQRGLGEPCFHDMNCTPDLRCTFVLPDELISLLIPPVEPGTCEDKLPDGESCIRFSKCKSWICSDYGEEEARCLQPTRNQIYCRSIFENQPADYFKTYDVP